VWPHRYHRRVTLSTALIRVSTILFAVIGLGYLVAPSAMLSIVGIDAEPTSDFLMRTEGVALLTGAGFLWAVRAGTCRQRQVVLLSLAGYYVVGSLVDLAAINDNIVGPASLPSAVIRIAVGVGCAAAAWRERSP
jgi:nitrogen fixation-related uncharacterized protein